MSFTLADFAREARSYFEHLPHHPAPGCVDGTGAVWRPVAGAPPWVAGPTGLITRAHGGMLSDDWRFAAIVRLLDVIVERSTPTPEDLDPFLAEQLVSGYAADLTAWLASHLLRIRYTDEAIATHGLPDPFDVIALLQSGQAMEYTEILAELVECYLDRRTSTEGGRVS